MGGEQPVLFNLNDTLVSFKSAPQTLGPIQGDAASQQHWNWCAGLAAQVSRGRNDVVGRGKWPVLIELFGAVSPAVSAPAGRAVMPTAARLTRTCVRK